MKVSVLSHIYDAIETEFFVEFKFYLAKRRNSTNKQIKATNSAVYGKKKKKKDFCFFELKY